MYLVVALVCVYASVWDAQSACDWIRTASWSGDGGGAAEYTNTLKHKTHHRDEAGRKWWLPSFFFEPWATLRFSWAVDKEWWRFKRTQKRSCNCNIMCDGFGGQFCPVTGGVADLGRNGVSPSAVSLSPPAVFQVPPERYKCWVRCFYLVIVCEVRHVPSIRRLQRLLGILGTPPLCPIDSIYYWERKCCPLPWDNYSYFVAMSN